MPCLLAGGLSVGSLSPSGWPNNRSNSPKSNDHVQNQARRSLRHRRRPRRPLRPTRRAETLGSPEPDRPAPQNMYHPCTNTTVNSGNQRGKGSTRNVSSAGEKPPTRYAAIVRMWSHNPKVAGSNPAPATKKALVSHYGGPGLRRSPARLLMVLLMLFADRRSQNPNSQGVSTALLHCWVGPRTDRGRVAFAHLIAVRSSSNATSIRRAGVVSRPSS